MQLYVVLRKGLGSRQWPMTLAVGWSWSVRLWTDSSACKGTCGRSALGRLKHLDVEDVWLQEAVKNKKVGLFKIAGVYNMADLLTKHLGRATLDRHVSNLGLRDA